MHRSIFTSPVAKDDAALIAQAVRYRPESAKWNWDVQVIDEPAKVVEAIFKHYETRGFEPSPAERQVQLYL